jgi:nucleoside-diphosphate-sugar epimerase
MRKAGGAFNIAAEPVLTPDLIASAFGAARTVPFRADTLRAIMDITWRLRLQATDPGWLDIAVSVPVMSTERARQVLGWSPAIPATDAIAEIVEAVANRSNLPASGPLQG